MESMLYQGHRFLGGIKHFWMAMRSWKMNLVLEDLARQKRTKIWPKWGLSWGLIDVWQSEFSVLLWGPWKTQKKGSSCSTRDFGHLDAASRQRSLSHCHLRERIFDQKGYSSVSAAPILDWYESVWFLPFPETQIPQQRSSFWNYGQHPKGRNRPAEGTATCRLPSTASGRDSNVFGGVWLPKGKMLICSSVVNKQFYSTFSLYFRHISY